MEITAIIFLCAVVTWAMIIYLNKTKYYADIRSLNQTAEGHDVTRFNPTMVAGLPDPVQRYLLKVIPEGFGAACTLWLAWEFIPMRTFPCVNSHAYSTQQTQSLIDWG